MLYTRLSKILNYDLVEKELRFREHFQQRLLITPLGHNMAKLEKKTMSNKCMNVYCRVLTHHIFISRDALAKKKSILYVFRKLTIADSVTWRRKFSLNEICTKWKKY